MPNCTVKLIKMSKAPSLDDIMSKLNEIGQTTTSSASKLDSYMEKTDSLSDTVSSISSTVKSYDDRIAALEHKINQLVAAKSNNMVRMDDESAKQEALRRNICICGIPHTVNEDLGAILSALSSAIGCSYDPLDFADKYRVKTNTGSLIVIRFNNFKKKLEFLAASKKKGKLLVSNLNLNVSSSNSTIYINNHLTPHFAKIFRMGRQAVIEKRIDSCWFALNCVCIVQSPGGDKQLVKSIREMEQLTNASTNMDDRNRSLSSDPLGEQAVNSSSAEAISAPSDQSTLDSATNRKRKATKSHLSSKANPKKAKQDNNIQKQNQTPPEDQPITD